MEGSNLEVLIKRMQEEPFAKLFGLHVTALSTGYARVEMDFRPDMENIFGLAHGGAIFALIDDAFQGASNSHGIMAVALNINVTYHRSPTSGAHLIAEAKEIAQTKRTASYHITVTEPPDLLIASCHALVYRTGKPLPFFAASPP